jgi:uncharacterized protein (TIGR00725 family)
MNAPAPRTVIGVMGRGAGAAPVDCAQAAALGEALARAGWVLLTGGRPAGVMAAATAGAKRVPESLVVGVLPGESDVAAAGVDIAIRTGMGNARNVINVLTSDVVVAIGAGGAGTASEIALAIKCARPVVLLGVPEALLRFALTLGGRVVAVDAVDEAVAAVRRLLGSATGSRA